MQVINLTVKEKNKIYFFNHLTGAIYVNESNNNSLFNNSKIPKKVELALDLNNNPYSLSNTIEINHEIITSSLLNLYGLNL